MQVTIETDVLSSLVASANSILKKGRDIRIVAQSETADGIGSISVVSIEDTTVSAWHGQADVHHSGSIAVRGDIFDRFLKLSSKSDKTIKLETFDVDNKFSLRVITARGAHEFDGCPEEIFEDIDPGESGVPLGDLKDFAEALKIAKSTAAAEADVAGARIAFSGVNVQLQGSEFHIAGTDGKRLAHCALHSKALLQSGIPPEGITIPGGMVAKIVNIIEGEPAAIRLDVNTLIVENGEGAMSFPIIEADYPDYRGLLSFKGEHALTVPAKMVLAALDRSSAAIGQEERYLTATLLRDEDGIHLSSHTSKESSSEMISEKGGDACEISFNVTFMKRAISNLDSKDVLVQFTDTAKPMLITCEDRPDLTMMVMPCKAKSHR